jgi:hypothetical protein
MSSPTTDQQARSSEVWLRFRYETGRAMHAGWKRQKIANGFADHPLEALCEPNAPCDMIDVCHRCELPPERHHPDMIDWDDLPEHQQAINYEGGRDGFEFGYNARALMRAAILDSVRDQLPPEVPTATVTATALPAGRSSGGRVDQVAPRPGDELVTPIARTLFDVSLTDGDTRGRARYGTGLMTHNGRDAGLDCAEELIDAWQYLTQLRLETRDLRDTIEDLDDCLTKVYLLVRGLQALDPLTGEPERLHLALAALLEDALCLPYRAAHAS